MNDEKWAKMPQKIILDQLWEADKQVNRYAVFLGDYDGGIPCGLFLWDAQSDSFFWSGGKDDPCFTEEGLRGLLLLLAETNKLWRAT